MEIPASALIYVSNDEEKSLPNLFYPYRNSSVGEHNTVIFGSIEDVVEWEPWLVSATRAGFAVISSRGLKSAEGDSKVLEAWHLLFEENVIHGSSSESTTSITAPMVTLAGWIASRHKLFGDLGFFPTGRAVWGSF